MVVLPFPRRLPRREGQRPSQENHERETEMLTEDEFYPDIDDVLKVRHIFLWKVKPEGLPVEVVDMIVDAAEYWPSTKVKLEKGRRINKDVDEAMLCTNPLCYDEKTLDSSRKTLPHRTVHPCRKIIFSIVSHDQGGYSEHRWAGHERPAPYEGSFTWFDAEFIHNSHEPSQQTVIHEKMNPTDKSPKHFAPDNPLLLPRGNCLQRNRARMYGAKRHDVVWHYLDDVTRESQEAEDAERETGRGRDTLAGKQVREMRIGDSIVVWARARFPGWVNYVDELSVRVFWAI
ncbi:hypothetical protein BDV18DRAFT_163429 [Aspergillus unguis]